MTQSYWQQIAARFDDFPHTAALAALRDLALRIDDSPWQAVLKGHTGVTELCIGRSNDHDDPAFIRITPIRQSHLEIRYVDSCIVRRQWYRIIPADTIWPVLLSCLERRDWQANA